MCLRQLLVYRSSYGSIRVLLRPSNLKLKYHYFKCVHLVTAEQKRLLLNDPDVLVNRLNRVENIVAILNATVKQLFTENQQQTLTIQQQEKTIQQHQISTLQQQAWITQQNISNQQQQATLQQQQALIQQQQKTIQQQQTINQQQQTTNQQLEQTIKQLQSSIDSIPTLGTTYVRWGRKQCPNNNTELVYSGFAGGSHYTDKGAAAEYVCLPPDPNYVKTSGGDYGRMFGAEFDNNFFASNADNEDVPCALCRTKLATSVIMIPGKNTCYKGWKVEYHGYLASGYRAHVAASAYACVELNPEYIIGGVDQHLGKLFYEVLSICGSLKCPPYINNYPLTCVVCSK